MTHAYDNLLTVGFFYDETKGLCFPDGKSVPSRAMERLRHMSGRLENISYMARRMDSYDGIQGADLPAGTAAGHQQFDHLIARHPAAAVIYFALRRLQRAGDIEGLRHGLAILLAYDHDEMCAEDAVNALWPIRSDMPKGLPELTPELLALPAA